MKLSKSTMQRKVYEGIEGNGWSVITNWEGGSQRGSMKLLFDYLERKGIELTE